jgi:BMFP domain-containing protein YqiC
MNERPRFFDDLAGVAGGAFSAFAGLRDEAEAMMRARMDEAIRKFDLVKREDLDAVQEMAANARAGQEAAEAKLAVLEQRIAALEAVAGAGSAVDAVGEEHGGMGGARGGMPGEPGFSTPIA